MKRIAVTMGEPGGVGPEVIVKALSDPATRELCSPVIIGDSGVIKKAVETTGLHLRVLSIKDLSESTDEPGTLYVIDAGSSIDEIKSAPSREAGMAVVEYIKSSVQMAMEDEVHAVVTGPISKESLKMAGHGWPGHTELLGELTGKNDFSMLFVSEKLRVILCTIHISLKNVTGALTSEVVYRTVRNAGTAATMLGIKNAKIAVAGLNPHAGEMGLMGDEESAIIIPAIKMAGEEGIDVSGPYPPDVVFHRAYNGEFDIVVCMYHDQGLIPFKMLAFDTGVNVTVGLPIIRTSPDHGTAFDIAWKNRANPSSMIEAIKLAGRLRI